MGKFLEATYRDWIPASGFSYYTLGILSCVSLEKILPDLTLIWIVLHLIFIIFFSLLRSKKEKAVSFSWGAVFFLFLSVSGHSQRTAPFLEQSQVWKKDFSLRIEGLLDQAEIRGEAKEISMGLVLGDAKNLSREFKKSAREGGILHLFAASGLHLGILLGCIYGILKRFPFLGYAAPRIIPVAFGLSYLAALGFPVSLARAWVFASWLLLQGLAFRKSRPVDLLLGSLGVLYLWDPNRAFGVSFLLSFGAVASILLLLPCLENCLPKKSEEGGFLSKVFSFCRENILVSSAAGLGTLPSLVYYFGSYSFGSLGLNFILVPICGVLLPLLYLSLALQAFLPIYIIKPLWFSVLKLLDFLEFTTLFWSENEGTILRIYRGDTKWFAIGIWLLLVIFLVFWKLSRSESKSEASPLNLSDDPIGTRSDPFRFSSRIWTIGLSICIGAHILIAFSSNWILTPPIFLGDRFSFLIREKGTLVLAGKCKYSGKLLFQSIGKDPELFCGKEDSLEEVYIEHESCIEWALRCADKRRKIALKFGGKRKPEGENLQGWQLISKRSEFLLPLPDKKLIRFEIGKDSLSDLARKSKAGNGWILLVPRFGIPEDSKEWNSLRKRLGIGQGWKFIGGDELPGIPVF